MHAPYFVVGCPHCRNPISCDPRMPGHAVACPHCRGPVTTPTAPAPPSTPAYPPNTPGSLHVRVTYTRHGYDRQPDFGSSVILVPTELRAMVPIWVIDGPEWELLRDEEMERVREWATSVGVRSATVGFEGEIAIENLRPGGYWLAILSHAASLPLCEVMSDKNPTLQTLSGHLSGLEYGAVNGRKVIVEEIAVFPGQRVARELCFTLLPGEPTPDLLHYEIVVREAQKKRRGELEDDRPIRSRPGRRREEAEKVGCSGWLFLFSLVFLFFLVAASILIPVFRGR